jgi:transcriptional regulator of acetoin/glycerol metabolism
VLLANGDTLQATDLPLELRQVRAATTSPAPVLTRAEQHNAAKETERAMLLDALGRANGDVPEAARLIGYSRSQFYRLLKKHHINV